MPVPRFVRRHFTWLALGIAVAAAVLGATIGGLLWGALAAEWASVIVFSVVAAGTFGLVAWHVRFKAVVVEESAPRTVQYVVVQPIQASWTSYHYPRSHPAEDGRTLQMWAALQDDTGDIARMR